jgi:hypothetical protein
MKQALDAYHAGVAGNTTNLPSFLNFIREMHGQDTGDALAKAGAEGYRAAKEFLRQSFNELGGDIGFLADHGLTHSHDRKALLKVGFDQWGKDIFDLLDWSRIDNFKTGKPFASQGGRPNRAVGMEFLKGIYDGIITRGWDTREPSFAVGGKALYNQNAEARVLHFKDGDAWLKYNEGYGNTDPFTAMMQGLQGMSNDVALMRVLGPSPRAGLEFAIQSAEKRAADLTLTDPKAGAKMTEQVRTAATRNRARLALLTGEANVPENAAMANFFSGQRSWLVAAQLGRAALSAPSDLVTTATASFVAGMHPLNTLGRFVKLVASPGYREQAAQMGHIMDALMESASGAARWTGESIANGIPQRLAHITMRSTGLSAWTDIVRTAVRMEHSAWLAREAGKSFDQLPPPMAATLRLRGITPADWDLLRDPAHHFVADNGARFISPSYWLESKAPPGDPFRAQAQELAMRLMAGVEDEVEAAVPSASLKGRAALSGGKPGTIPGEFMRSALTYKTYTLSLMMKQIDQLSRIQGASAKAGYLTMVPAALTLMSALNIQMNEISKGNDPRPMNDSKFWLAALVKGGGIGIFGDFFASSTSRVGLGPLGTAMGPGAAMLNDVVTRVGSNAAAAANGKPTHVGRDMVDLLRRYMPITSSHWAIATAWDRLVSDNLQLQLDPQAQQSWRDAEARHAKDYGTRPWWPHGQNVPSRAPDLGNALGQ